MATLMEDFEKSSMQLVTAAIDYAGKNVWDATTDADIRRMRVLIPVLNAAVSQASQVREPPPAPPAPPQ